MAELESRLRRTNQKQAALYLFCNFISLMLMTAYSGLMFSPTVQDIFPPGGDSRKQLYAIFVLALFGCVIFTIYAASLFFRKKSRQLGILMALGASRKTLAPGLFREVLLLSGSSAVLGTLAGFPFLFLLWTAFRIFIVNSEEMVLNVDFRCLWVSAGFTALVVICACVLAFLYMKRTNILDVIQEEHQNEPVKELGRWCGPVGIVLILAGAVAGYEGPTVYMNVFHRYPSPFLNLLYAPAFAGLYMVMLHTVVNGWTSRRKNPWKNIIARSMMKFQGKQTVNSLLVTTVLVAGGCFGIFYLPMLHTGLSMGSESRAYDYSWFWPSDQSLPSEEEIYSLAEKHDFQIKDWLQCSYLSLACDNNMQILNPDNTLSYQHFDIADECHALSESTYNQITGQNISLDPGFFYAVTNEEETAYDSVENATLFTNMTTRKELPVTCKGFVHFEDMASHGTAVLDDNDYEKISQGLAPEWTGSMIWFNSEGKDSYAFAQELFVKIVNSYDDQHFSNSYYDPVQYVMTEGYTNNYYGSTYTVSPEERQVDRTNINSSDFRMYWIDARPDVFQVIKEKCFRFWNENVLKKIPPDPINIDDVLQLYGKSNGKAVEAQGELAIDYGEYARIAGEIKELKKQQDALKTKIAISMKDNEILTLDGKKVLTYKTQTSKRFDSDSFREDHLDDYYDYLKESSTRVMRVCA